tara:strand:+ start:439 stop:1755 length:1317 start_codon:yes stop_codon:yes gene_type:complete
MNIDNQKDSPNNDLTFHGEVEERLKWWSEKHNKTMEEAREEFTAYLLSDLGISNPKDEDDDFLIEAAESFMVERRVMSSTSSANATELVGYFIGVDSKVRDGQERKRAPAVTAAMNDLSEAINLGLVARAYTEGGVWMLEKKDGPVKTEESADDKPWFLFDEHGLSIAILQNNADWSRFGEPITPYRWQRTYHFFGNEKSNFMDAQETLRITITSKTAEDWHVPQMFEPCTLKVRARNGEPSKGWENVWNGLPFPASVTYGNIVEEQYMDAIKPERLLPSSDAYVKDLSTLGEIFDTKSETIAGFAKPIGPMVLIKAKVSDLRLEPSDYEYDPTGHTYFMRVTSFDLMRSFGEGNRRDIGIGIHGFLGDEAHPFEVATDEGYKPYAVKSTVIIYGRLGVSLKDDDIIPKINAVGIYAVPRLAIPAGEGGETTVQQYGE